MGSVYHDEVDINHIPYNTELEYADIAAREGATGLLARQIGEVGYQLDDSSYWILEQVTPVVRWRFYAGENATRQNTNIYIDPVSGSDATGNGSSSYPFKSFTKAFEYIPHLIRHVVKIIPKAGSYTSFPNTLDNKFDRDGLLVIESEDLPTEVLAEQTTTGLTAKGLASNKAGWNLTVSGAGWTNDQFHGNFVEFTSGNANGKVFSIFGNTTDTIEITGQPGLTISSGDKFKVIEPSVSISVDHRLTFNFEGGRGSFAQFYLGNVIIITDGVETHEKYADAFVWDCNLSGIMAVCVLKDGGAYGPVTYSQYSGQINNGTLLDLGASLRVASFAYSFNGSLQILKGDNVPSSASDNVWLFGNPTVLANACFRNGISIEGRASIYFSFFARVNIDHRAFCKVGSIRIAGELWGTDEALRVDDASHSEIEGIWIDRAKSYALEVSEGSLVVSDNSGCDSANIPSYGARIGSLSRYVMETGAGLIGNGGEAYWILTSTGVSYPASGNSVTDSNGAFIVVN